MKGKIWISATALFLFWPALGLGADRVNVRLDWVLRGNHAMFFVAKEKGYFKANGIEVEKVDPGNGSVRTMQFVGGGEYPVGYGDLPTMAMARSQGVPVRSLAVVNQLSPMALVSLKETGINQPKDLEGKTMGVFPAGSTHIFYKAFVKLAGIDRSKVKEVTVTFPYESFLLLKRVDAVVGYIDAEIPILQGKAQLSIIQGAKWGYNGYGSGVVASDEVIRKSPDMLRRFTQAYVKAFADVIKNPDEACQLMAKYTKNPILPIWKAQLVADIESSFMSEDTKKYGLGWQTRELWATTQQVLVDQGVIKTPVPVEALYTNDFLPKPSAM